MTQAAFDLPETQRFNLARRQYLERFIDEVRGSGRTLATSADVGCGFGYFTAALLAKGLQTVAIDGRADNVAEAEKRNPTATVAVYNVEDPRIAGIGKVDLVVCLGLMYHLENPFQAMRNLRAIAADLLFVESVCAPSVDPITVMYQEDVDIDQGLNYVAMIPSEGWLVNAMTVAGFKYVYRPLRMPDHPYFRPSLSKERRRTVLIAADRPLDVAGLASARPGRMRQHLWDRTFLRPWSEMTQLRAAARAVRKRFDARPS